MKHSDRWTIEWDKWKHPDYNEHEIATLKYACKALGQDLMTLSKKECRFLLNAFYTITPADRRCDLEVFESHLELARLKIEVLHRFEFGKIRPNKDYAITLRKKIAQQVQSLQRLSAELMGDPIGGSL